MSKIKIIIAVVILFLLLAVFIPGYSKLQKLKSAKQGLTKKIEKLKIENIQLTREVKKLKEDPLYLEKVARKEMGISKKGEVIYKLLPAEPVPVPAEAGKARSGE